MENTSPYTVQELVSRWRVSRTTIHNLVKNGAFPNAWIAGKKQYRIPASDVQAFEAANRVVNRIPQAEE